MPNAKAGPSDGPAHRLFNKSNAASDYDEWGFQYLPPNVEPYYEDLWRYLPANAFAWCELLARYPDNFENHPDLNRLTQRLFTKNDLLCKDPTNVGGVERRYGQEGMTSAAGFAWPEYAFCPPPCEEVGVEVVSDQTGELITEQQHRDDLAWSVQDGEPVDAANLAEIRIFYPDFSELKREGVRAVTTSGLLGSIGGNLGLFLGVSIATLVEVLEWLGVIVVVHGLGVCVPWCQPTRQRRTAPAAGQEARPKPP